MNVKAFLEEEGYPLYEALFLPVYRALKNDNLDSLRKDNLLEEKWGIPSKEEKILKKVKSTNH